jgi:allantoinase
VLTDVGLRDRAVSIRDGRIEAVVAPEALARGTSVDDFGDAVVMPGLVDCHVHVNEPGRTEWEGFETATRAAAWGGVTTLVDMPLNSTPVTTSAGALAAKRESAQGKLHVDVGYWGGVVPGNAAEIEGLARGGVLGCKAFLVHSGIDDFPNVSEADLRRAMPRLAEAGLPLLAHAELELPTRAPARDRRDYRAWLESRPREWEDRAIELLIRLCRETGCAVHVVHLSSATALPLLARARSEGLPISVETCPHYLCLSAEDVPLGDTRFKCAPPIRERTNRDALWQGLVDGIIDFVVTDHSPCTPGLKQLGAGDFTEAWGGIASLSLGLPSLWTEARARGIGIEQLAGWLSAGPAAFAGLAADKGRLAPGMDADLVVWQPEVAFRVDAVRLPFRHKLSPYEGQELHGDVVATYLRGHKIHDRGQVAGEPRGRELLGRQLTPRGASPAP